MKICKFPSYLAVVFYTCAVWGFSLQPRQDQTACQPVKLDAKTNVWKNYSLHINPFYRQSVLEAAERVKDETLKKKALKVADVGSFFWLNNVTAVSKLERILQSVPCDRIVGLVLQGLQSGNCANPNARPVLLEAYKKDYIDPLATTLKAHATTAFVIIIEPWTLSSLVTNLGLAACRGGASSFRTNVAYALKTLNLSNVIMYIDAGHGGTVGWDANLKPAAAELSAVYKEAESPSQVRGIAVNTAGWNSWDLSPGEFTSDCQSTLRNHAQNEKTFVTLLGKLLNATGTPNHAIMDTSRNGLQGLRYNWSSWCNIEGAAFGKRPTSDEKKLGLDLADAFVWVKGGGISDGTSDATSPNFDPVCGLAEAFKPSPEAGEWNQQYFEMMLKNDEWLGIFQKLSQRRRGSFCG